MVACGEKHALTEQKQHTVDVNNCLDRVKLPIFIDTSASYDELPFNISTMAQTEYILPPVYNCDLLFLQMLNCYRMCAPALMKINELLQNLDKENLDSVRG